MIERTPLCLTLFFLKKKPNWNWHFQIYSFDFGMSMPALNCNNFNTKHFSSLKLHVLWSYTRFYSWILESHKFNELPLPKPLFHGKKKRRIEKHPQPKYLCISNSFCFFSFHLFFQRLNVIARKYVMVFSLEMVSSHGKKVTK